MPADILFSNPALSEEPQTLIRRLPQQQQQPQLHWSLASERGFSDVHGSLQGRGTALAFRWPASCCSDNLGFLDIISGIAFEDPDQGFSACDSTIYPPSCVDETQILANALEITKQTW